MEADGTTTINNGLQAVHTPSLRVLAAEVQRSEGGIVQISDHAERQKVKGAMEQTLTYICTSKVEEAVEGSKLNAAYIAKSVQLACTTDTQFEQWVNHRSTEYPSLLTIKQRITQVRKHKGINR